MRVKKIFVFVICALLALPAGVSADYADGGKFLDFSDFVAGNNNSYYNEVFQYRGDFKAGTDPEGVRGNNIKFTVSGTAGECFMHTKVERDCVFGASFYVDENIFLTVSGKGLGNVWGDTAISNIMNISDGSIKLMGNKDENIVSYITEPGWIDMRAYLEYSAHKIHIYLYCQDGSLISNTYNLNTAVAGNEYFAMTSGVKSTPYDFYVDDVVLYYTDSESFNAEMIHGEITDGMMDELDIVFSKDIVTENSGSVLVTDSEGNELNFDFEELKTGRFTNGFRLTFPEPLDEFGSYTLSFGDGISSITGDSISFEEKIFSSKPSVSIESFESDIYETGTSMTLKIDSKKPGSAKLWCVHNGEWISITDIFEFEVVSGENRIYAVITDEEGGILAESDEIIVYGADYSITAYNTDDDFDSRTIPVMNYAASGGEAKIVDGGGKGGNVLKLVSYAGAQSQSFFASNRIDDTSNSKKVVFEGDFKFEDFNTVKSPLSLKADAVGSTASSWPALFSVTTEGEVLASFYDGNKKESLSVGNVELNKWYSFKIAVDMKSQTSEWWFEGKKVLSGERPWALSVTMDVIHYTNTGTGVSAENDTVMYVDNVKSYYLAPNAICSYDFNSVAPYACTGLEMTVNFSENMSEDSLGNITVTDKNGNPEEFETVLVENVLTVKFSELNPDTEYTVSLDGVKTAEGAGISGNTFITFKTDKKPFCIKDASMKLSGSSLKVSALVRTDDSMEKSTLNICVYNSGAMIASKAVCVDMSKPGSVREYTAEFDVPSNGQYSVGVYLIDGFENINIVDIEKIDSVR